jgi:hypothetical protein
MDQRSSATIAVAGQQPLRLPQAHAQNTRRRLRRAPAGQNLTQNFYPLQILFAHT